MAMELQALGRPRCREEGQEGGAALLVVRSLTTWAPWAGARGAPALLRLRPLVEQAAVAGTMLGAAVGAAVLASRAAGAALGTAALPSLPPTPRA